MSLPNNESNPEDKSRIATNRRRRGRRSIISMGRDEKAAFLDKLGRSTLPSFDFFLFSLITGAIIAAGILLDSPTLFVLAALAAPLFSPLIGISLSSILGSGWYFTQSLFGSLLGAFLVFLTGVLAGLASPFFHTVPIDQTILHTHLTWVDFLALVIGMVLSTVSLVRSEGKSSLASAILAYEIYIPIGVAGYGLCLQATSGASNALWPAALVTFFFSLSWTILVGIITLWFVKIRPRNLWGYLFGLLVVFALLGMGFWANNFQWNLINFGFTNGTQTPTSVSTSTPNTENTALSSMESTSTPSITFTLGPEIVATETLSATPTHTLVPSATFTETLTPDPTPVWAIVNVNNGAIVRAQPDYNATVVDTIMDGSLVQVLPDTVKVGGVTWAHIITNSNIEGWIVRSVLVTATPMPNK